MADLQHLRLERPSEGVVVLTLDNPEMRNAMSEEMTESWVRALDELAAMVLACLTTLSQPRYGYALLETLAQSGFAVDGNTLYPLLRRLEKQGLLTSEWNTDEARPRKFYRTSSAGAALAASLTAEFEAIAAAIASLTPEN